MKTLTQTTQRASTTHETSSANRSGVRDPRGAPRGDFGFVRRGDDTVGNPHRAQISQFELFELILLSKLDKQLPVERFEATASQPAAPSPPLDPAETLASHPAHGFIYRRGFFPKC